MRETRLPWSTSGASRGFDLRCRRSERLSRPGENPCRGTTSWRIPIVQGPTSALASCGREKSLVLVLINWRWGLSKVGVGCANSPGDSRQSGPRCVSVCSCVPTGRNIWAASLGIAASPSPLLKQWTPLAGSRAWDRESDRGEGAGILDSDEIGEDVISDYIALLDPERNHTSPSLHVLCLPCLLAPRDAQT